MKSTVAALLLALGVPALLLALGVPACSRLGASAAFPESLRENGVANSSSYRTIVRFNRNLGCKPFGGVASHGGLLYGSATCGGQFANGTIFRLSPAGKARRVHSFAQDGKFVFAPPTIVGGVTYGTAVEGGKHGQGTVYSLSANGKVRWFYSFKGSPDGASPYGPLIDVGGTLYGTTRFGGTDTSCYFSGEGCGTVFKVTAAGQVSVIYSFHGKDGDGERPAGGLTNVNGTMFGATMAGGYYGGGTIFSITTTGAEQVIYQFGRSDGFSPAGSLVYAKGALYGATDSGGGSGSGTVFRVTTLGKEHVVYSFGKGSDDGADPLAGLVELHGMLFGTTEQGGSAGEGTIFELSVSGKERVLHSFTGGEDGEEPQGQLAVVKGVIYGTTPFGGGASFDGTAFALTP